jgi:hypothetical protein
MVFPGRAVTPAAALVGVETFNSEDSPILLEIQKQTNHPQSGPDEGSTLAWIDAAEGMTR